MEVKMEILDWSYCEQSKPVDTLFEFKKLIWVSILEVWVGDALRGLAIGQELFVDARYFNNFSL